MPSTPRLPFDPIRRARENWQAHGFDEPDVMAAVTSIMRVHQVLLQRIDRLLEPYDLTFARYEVLVLLTFSRTGELPLSRVGERLQVSPASVTNAIDRLERSGYVRREPHPTDGRTTLAVLTDAGRDTVDAATRSLTGARFGADGISDADARQLFRILAGFRAAAGDYPEAAAGDR